MNHTPIAADLWHLTTTSGHWDWSPRSDVTDEVLDDLRGVIGAARSTHGPVSFGDGIGALRIVEEGVGWAAFAVLRDGEALVTCAVYWTRDGAGHAAAFLDAAAAETLPGLLVRPERAMYVKPGRAWWVGQAETCFAWAFIEETT